MIGDLMLYAMQLALLIGLAALALERALAWRGLPRRGVWIASLALSVALPALSILVPRHTFVPLSDVTSAPPSSIATPNVAAPLIRAPPATALVATQLPPRHLQSIWPTHASLEKLLKWAWLAASVGLATFYAVLWGWLRIAARHWRRERIGGQDVWVTEALGPAVYGFIKPIILMPKWALDAPSNARAFVLAHEQEHIAARDPGWLLIGMLFVVIAPWNVPLWWQLRRLRFAIEVDCDARVLGRGADAKDYGEVLLAIGARRTFAPVGAIALTEPASQLLRRIRIMTTQLPKRSRWAVAAAIGLSLACAAIAAELRAPTLRTTPVAGEASADALRKPPVGEDRRQREVQNLVRATYPELFTAAAAPGPVLVTLFMNPDGTLYKSFRESIEPTPWIATSLAAFDAAGVDFEHRGDGVKLRMEGSPAARNHVDVRAWYLKGARDPTRDVAIVRAKVKARYASLFRPLSSESPSLVTVFMTESGDIDRAKVEAANGIDAKAAATEELFAAMGIPVDRIGPIGTTDLYAGHSWDSADLKILRIVYAWPRRSNEPSPELQEPAQPAPAGLHDDPAVNRLIAERYFPDLYTHPKEWPRADPWVLLSHEGEVLKAGRRVAMSGRDVQLYIESLYPGVRTDGVQVTTVHGREGERADVAFVWLAADSPVVDLSKADLSKRTDLFLYADVIGEGKTRPSELLALKFGSPAVTVCSLQNPFGVVHLQVTALESGADAVLLRVRLQHVLLGTTVEIPNAVETAWSPESAAVVAPYGGSAEVKVADQEGKSWAIVLHPDRVKGAATSTKPAAAAVRASAPVVASAETLPSGGDSSVVKRVWITRSLRGDTDHEFAREGNTFLARNVALISIIGMAEGVQPRLVVGGPGWLYERYDVRASGAFSPDEVVGWSPLLTEVMKNVEERTFEVRSHREMRRLPVYVLTTGDRGPNPDALMPALVTNDLSPGAPRSYPIGLLVGYLSNRLRHPVIDQTGLVGKYVYADAGALTASVAPELLPAAVRDRYGLNLALQEKAVEVLVIDHAVPPGDSIAWATADLVQLVPTARRGGKDSPGAKHATAAADWDRRP